MVSNRQRFHPLALGVFTIQNLRSHFSTFLFLSLVSTEWRVWIGWPFLALVLAGVRYATTSYAWDDQRVLVQRGLIEKKETEVPYSRIQTVRRRQWFFYAPFDLVQVDLDTASEGAGSELHLFAVSSSTYDQIRARVNQAKQGQDAQALDPADQTHGEPETQAPLYTMTVGDILLTTVTSQALLVGFLGVLAFGTQLLPEGDDLDQLGQALLSAGLWSMGLIVFGGLGLIFAAVFIRNILALYDFKLTAASKGLYVSRGLLERHEQIIPYGKIRGLEVSENLLRRPLRKSAVKVLIAGSAEEEGQMTSDALICPIIDQDRLRPLLTQAFPDLDLPTTSAWARPTQGRPWYFVRFPLLGGLAGAGGLLAASFLQGPWTKLAGMGSVLLVLFSSLWLLQALAKAETQAFATSPQGDFALATMAGLSRVRLVSQARHVQATRFHTTPFLDRQGIHHLSLYLKSQHPYAIQLRFLPPGSTRAFPLRGQAPLQVRSVRGAFGPVYEDALALRRRVFIEEQGVPPEIEHDDLDAIALHLVLYAGPSPLACLRFLPEEEGQARLTRFAVHPDHRRQGHGRRLLEAGERQLRALGIASIQLHAQVHAIAFYESMDYEVLGEPYDEAGIPHQSMRKDLPT